MPIDYKKANLRIRSWGKQTRIQLQRQILGLGIRHTSTSRSPTAAVASLSDKYRSRDGIVNRIGYVMPRHLIYVHKGVGRGTTINQVGTTNRKPKEWFNPVINQRIDELADIVAEELGNSIINDLLIK